MPSDSNLTPPENEPRQAPINGDVGESPRVAEFGRPAARPASNGRPPLQRTAPPPPRTAAPPPRPAPSDEAILRNPYMLAGLAVGGAIFLAILVVFIGSAGSGSGAGGDDNGGVITNPLTPGPGRGIAARSVSTSSVREGPGREYVVIGELNRNQDVELVGRDDDATWFSIYFPPGSNLTGWVPSSALRLPDNAAALPVVSVTPIARPTAIIPTPPPEPTAEASATPTETPVGTPAGGSDLIASVVPGTCGVGTRLIVNIRNNGPAPITSRAVSVLVQAADGTQRALAAQTATIPPGGQIDIDTTYVVQERVIAIVDPLGTLGDPNPGNNRVDCVVSTVPTSPAGAGTGTPSGTAVPPPIGTTPTQTPGP